MPEDDEDHGDQVEGRIWGGKEPESLVQVAPTRECRMRNRAAPAHAAGDGKGKHACRERS